MNVHLSHHESWMILTHFNTPSSFLLKQHVLFLNAGCLINVLIYFEGLMEFNRADKHLQLYCLTTKHVLSKSRKVLSEFLSVHVKCTLKCVKYT